MSSSHSPFISPLPRPTSTQLRSSVVIPSFAQVLNELAQNSLDAGATKIDIWLDLAPSNEIIRIEDDGSGIGLEDLSRVGGRYRTSKLRNGEGLGSDGGSYGYRGEALASISALGMVEITTKTKESEITSTKILKNSRELYTGASKRGVGRPHGTTIVVRELFGNIPVRRAAMDSANPTSTLAACKKVIEVLALGRPGVCWTLKEERMAGTSKEMGAKRILAIPSTRNSLEVYRSLYGNHGVEKVQKIRVSSGSKRIDGFISLSGAITKSQQYLYVNNYPLQRSGLHQAITKRFAQSRFSAMTDDGSTQHNSSQRKSPRRLERYPIYVLNITLPPGDIDTAYDPKKGILGHRDMDALMALVLAVVDECLNRQGFAYHRKDQDATDNQDSLEVDCSPSKRSTLPDHNYGRQIGRDEAPTPRPVLPLPSPSPRIRNDSDTETNFFSAHKTLMKARECMSFRTPSPLFSGIKRQNEGPIESGSGRKKIKWIDDIVNSIQGDVFQVTPPLTIAGPGYSSLSRSRDIPSRHAACNHCSPQLSQPKTAFGFSKADVSYSSGSLRTANVLGQIDNKFIACVMDIVPSNSRDPPSKSLVLIDQHAADERVLLENILGELCDGFRGNDMPAITLEGNLPIITLSQQEAVILGSTFGLAIFRRWGIHLEFVTDGDAQAEEVSQAAVLAVPATLRARLGKSNASEITRLVKLYLSTLAEDYGELEILIKKCDAGKDVDWERIVRWMPVEMLELAKSKACRTAIMFGDTLDQDQCQRLIQQLSLTRHPFSCAHGRPSLVPLTNLALQDTSHRRPIDWGNAKRSDLKE